MCGAECPHKEWPYSVQNMGNTWDMCAPLQQRRSPPLSSVLPASMQMVGNRGKESAGICLFCMSCSVQTPPVSCRWEGTGCPRHPAPFHCRVLSCPVPDCRMSLSRHLKPRKAFCMGSSQIPSNSSTPTTCVQVREHQTNPAPNSSQKQGLLSTLPVLVG